jgi:murein DD-endopeptidase MepM/ murein hydrolase activator NlpD
MSKKHDQPVSDKKPDKYRLIIYNDQTFEEIGLIRLSRLDLIALVSTVFILIVAGVFALVAYTGIRELIPGYPDGNMRRSIIMNAIRLDSLENEIRLRDRYFKNLNALVSGEAPDDMMATTDTAVEVGDIQFSTSIEDSILRTQIEEEEQYNLLVNEQESYSQGFTGVHFFAPIKGMVTNSFNASENHFGTDIVAAPNEVVKATLDGTIILATWTVETGYVIQIQHNNNLISVYKHNAELLKKIGNLVRAGDAIAIIGNSGELTTGPHLHFEIWHNGTPVDPEQFIVF